MDQVGRQLMLGHGQQVEWRRMRSVDHANRGGSNNSIIRAYGRLSVPPPAGGLFPIALSGDFQPTVGGNTHARQQQEILRLPSRANLPVLSARSSSARLAQW